MSKDERSAGSFIETVILMVLLDDHPDAIPNKHFYDLDWPPLRGHGPIIPRQVARALRILKDGGWIRAALPRSDEDISFVLTRAGLRRARHESAELGIDRPWERKRQRDENGKTPPKRRGRPLKRSETKMDRAVRTMLDNGDAEQYGRKWKSLLIRYKGQLPKRTTSEALRKAVEREEARRAADSK